MVVICCMCKVTIRVVAGDKDKISHGICKACDKKFREENGLKSC